MSINQPRNPKGVPTGGQWRATGRPEGNARLTDQSADPWTAARFGHLPASFDRWELADDGGGGWTVAHVAALWGHLPADFDRWEIADRRGWTVAYEAALYGTLPPDFDRWDLADRDGRTVAHVAVESGYLPDDFDCWVPID